MPAITHILWTFSWQGFSVKYNDGTYESLSPRQLMERVGESEYLRLNKIAHQFPCNCYKETK